MSLTPEPGDKDLFHHVLKLTRIKDREGKAAFKRARAGGIAVLLREYSEVGMELKRFLQELSDRDLAFMYAVWNSGRTHTSGKEKLCEYTLPQISGWRKEALNALLGSVNGVQYLKEGAKVMRIGRNEGCVTELKSQSGVRASGAKSRANHRLRSS